MERLIDKKLTAIFLAAKAKSKSPEKYALEDAFPRYRNPYKDRAEVRASSDENSAYLLCIDAAERPLE